MSNVERTKSNVERKARSRAVDGLLLATIRESPGLSLYELRKLTRWSNGKIDGSLRRLLNSKKILVSEMERSGRRVNLVYPKPKKPNTVIEIPKSLLPASNPAWKENAFFYALDNLSIGVTGERFPEWEKAARFNKKIRPASVKNHMILSIPQEFIDFYHLIDKHITKSISENRVLLTINGRIVSSKPYPS